MEAGIVRERESNDSLTGATDKLTNVAERTSGRSGGGKELDTPLSESDVLAIIAKAHRETTEESLKGMEEATSVSSGKDLLMRAEQLGFDRGELRKAIVERVRENQKLDPLQSDVERERERLGLSKDATAIDVAQERTVRKQVDELIGKFTSHLQALTANGIKEGVNTSQFCRKTFNLEVPQHVAEIPGGSSKVLAERACNFARFLGVGVLLLTLAVLPYVPVFFSGLGCVVGGLASMGSLKALHFLSKNAPIDLTKPTSSPAINDLYAFCKNNGIKIRTEGTEAGTRQFVFDM